MTERPFNPEQPATKIHGSDGSRFIQDGHFYGGPPHYKLISAPSVAHLAGVQDADGNVLTLNQLPPEQLQQLAQDMEIPGASGMNQADLAAAIAAESVLIETNASDVTGQVIAPVVEPVAPVVDLLAPPAVEPVVYTMEQLDDMKVTELRELAKTLGVNGRNKDDLIAEILAAQAKAAAE